MSLILIEGFDHMYAGDLGRKLWHGSAFGVSAGRVSGVNSRAVDIINNNPLYKNLPSAYPTVAVGFAYKHSGGTGTILSLTGAGFAAGAVGIDSMGRLTIADQSATIVATGTTLLADGVWYYVELKVTVGGAGSASLHLNGVPGEIAATTSNYGSHNIDRVQLEAHGLGSLGTFDDLYVATDFLGEMHVETLYPRADGTYTQWTPDTGTDHHLRVKEGQGDSDASTVQTTTVNARDVFPMGPLGITTGTVYGAQLNLLARKNDAGARSIAPLIRQAGTDYVGSTVALAADYLFYSWLLEQDPSSSAWSIATINADEYGIKLIA